jgi:hypothetical protein
MLSDGHCQHRHARIALVFWHEARKGCGMVEQGMLRLAGRATPDLQAERMLLIFMKTLFSILWLTSAVMFVWCERMST